MIKGDYYAMNKKIQRGETIVNICYRIAWFCAGFFSCLLMLTYLL